MSDARIANNAEAHRGKTYDRHVAPSEDRRYQDGSMRTLELEWSPTMAYVVGLIASDGCLINDGRHLDFKSEDEQLVRTFLECLGRAPRYTPVRTQLGNIVYRAQFSDVRFYRWLQTIGLTPRKSLTIGALAVPGQLLFDLARGLLDGDGSILNFRYAGTGKARGHEYEALSARFVSGSRPHLDWLRAQLKAVVAINGSICRPSPRKSAWTLAYASRDSALLLPRIYPHSDVPKLERKWDVWRAYAERHSLRPTHDDDRVREAMLTYAASPRSQGRSAA